MGRLAGNRIVPRPARYGRIASPSASTTTGDQPPTDASPNGHGLAVSTVAQSAAVGGKNCNHGGAVSEAAHSAHSGGAQAGKKALNANAPRAPHSNGHRWGHAKP